MTSPASGSSSAATPCWPPRARTQEELLSATEKLLAPVAARVEAGKVITRYKTGKHFNITITITDDSLAIERRQDQIDAAYPATTQLRRPAARLPS
jgi:hypothetical protein